MNAFSEWVGLNREGHLEAFKLVLVGAKDRNEGFLWYIDLAELLHFCLALLLFFQKFLLSRDVAAIELLGHILAVRLDRRSRNDRAANNTLDRNLELVAGPADELSCSKNSVNRKPLISL